MATIIPAPQIAFTLQVRVTIDPKHRDIFIKHFKTAYDIVTAEPECAYFFVGESIQEPGSFHWTEGWTKGVQWFMTVFISSNSSYGTI
jgi:quinol monooxygenase YgiN